MSYISRKIATNLKHALNRNKSILLLGARQTGIHEARTGIKQPWYEWTKVRKKTAS